MYNNVSKKTLRIGVILLFLGSSIIPGISGNNTNINIWEQFNENGFGNTTNVAFRGIEIFNDTLIIGTANYNNETITVIGEPHTLLYYLINSFYHCLIKKDYMKSNGCEMWSYNEKIGWKQLIGGNEESIMKSGFGNKNNTEIGILIKFKDYLYAGIKNSAEGCQIWRTKDLDEEWECVAFKGLGNKNNSWFMEAAIFNDQLYFGTYNLIQGCEIFRTSDGTNWEKVVGVNTKTKNGFATARNFYCWSMEVYDGYLYVGTLNYIGGGEIWRSKDGTSWEPMVAYITKLGAKFHGADYPRGFDSGIRNYRGGIRNMAVYKGELYVGLTAEDKKFSIMFPFIGKFLNFSEGMFTIHQIRRFNSYGLDIFKYNSTTDKWKRVVGGLFKGNSSSGFGDYKNEYPWSMLVYNNYLYVGTLRIDPLEFNVSKVNNLKYEIAVNMPKGGGQIWRFDGNNWEKINENGFGDKYNLGIRELAIYKNFLIACTMNPKEGCEIWRYNLN